MLNTYSGIGFQNLWIILLLFLTASAYAQTSSELTTSIDNILKTNCLDQNKTAVSVRTIPSGDMLYAYQSDNPLLPASVMKLLTTAVALDAEDLGPDYRFKTTFGYTGQRKNGTIHGDFIIQGGGDPRLSTEHLWLVANRIKNSGINEVTGNLVIDTHFFDDYPRPPAELETEHTQRPYDAKLSAFSLNFNTIAVRVQPGNAPGVPLKAWLEPALPYIHLRNKGKTIKRGRSTIWAYRTETENGQIEIELKGKLPLKIREKSVYLNIDKPTHYAAETFRALLLKNGVSIKGSTQIVSTPIKLNKLYEHFSDNLSLILKELNVYSNNLTAEQIVKTIAAERYGSPGTHAEGIRLLSEFLRRHYINTDGIVIVDGSGLSRKNQMTTATITDLLVKMYRRFDIGPDFLASLRIIGQNALNSRRLRHSPARGQARGKTGTLKKVSTLAGYVANSKGNIFAFAFFLNNHRCGYYPADDIEDKIITAIYKFANKLPKSQFQSYFSQLEATH
jgi:serine-type D-Ala-D-Ala carboxypeptidase/endopeptidase (penicillin-binding protein 4)